MVAPDTIYFDGESLACRLPIFASTNIEYVNKNTFIEKVWDWIENNILSANEQDKSLLYYEQFKEYME